MDQQRSAMGIAGLDYILHGGLAEHRLYLIEGAPGAGKTTLAFQFLLEGARLGEPVLYVTLSETAEEISAVAHSHGWSMQGISIRELMPAENTLEPSEQYTVFHPTEVELSHTTQRILDDVDVLKPTRIVLDSLSELRLLAGSPLRYRRQILALKQYFAGRRCTVLMLDDLTSGSHDLQVQSIAHGALLLEHDKPDYGAPRRRLSVTKMRGSDFEAGYHDYQIRYGGMAVYPRLIAAEHRQASGGQRLLSGLAPLDALLGGGIERGTSTLVQGAPGTGKSTISAMFAAQAAERGERATFFMFDESPNTLLRRCDGLGIPMRRHVESGLIELHQVDPAELSPGQFADLLRRAADKDNASILVIDSLNGYLNSMPDEKFLVAQLHELLMYLGQKDIATLLVAAHRGSVGGSMQAPVDASYLADAVVLLRYFEDEGEVRQAVSVIKSRGGEHERSIRDFSMKGGRLAIGEPLRDYEGVFTGTPRKKRSR